MRAHPPTTFLQSPTGTLAGFWKHVISLQTGENSVVSGLSAREPKAHSLAVRPFSTWLYCAFPLNLTPKLPCPLPDYQLLYRAATTISVRTILHVSGYSTSLASIHQIPVACTPLPFVFKCSLSLFQMYQALHSLVPLPRMSLLTPTSPPSEVLHENPAQMSHFWMLLIPSSAGQVPAVIPPSDRAGLSTIGPLLEG